MISPPRPPGTPVHTPSRHTARVRAPRTTTARHGSWLTALAALALALLLLPAPSGAQQGASWRVGDQLDPVGAAIAMAQERYGGPDACPECARRVVIGRSDSFPDNLAGAAVSGRSSPLYLHPPAPAGLDARVRDDIVRVLGPRDPFPCHGGDADVLILGGTGAISQAVEDDLSARNYCVERLSGSGRIQTAIAIADFMVHDGRDPGMESPRTIPRVYIATAGNPADSAAASARAAFDFDPILVTGQEELHVDVADFLVEFEAQEVVLLGGTAALSERVESDVRFTARRSNVYRIAGAGRDETATRVAERLWPEMERDGVAVVNGYADDFWVWALPGAVLASDFRSPMLYVTATDVPPPTSDLLGRGANSWGYLVTIGPTERISEATAAAAERAAGL